MKKILIGLGLIIFVHQIHADDWIMSIKNNSPRTITIQSESKSKNIVDGVPKYRNPFDIPPHTTVLTDNFIIPWLYKANWLNIDEKLKIKPGDHSIQQRSYDWFIEYDGKTYEGRPGVLNGEWDLTINDYEKDEWPTMELRKQ